MNIIGRKKIWFAFSSLIIIAGLVAMMTSGLNYGIDFTGGTVMEINLHKDVPNEEIRLITDSVDPDLSINKIGSNKETVQIKTKKDMDNKARTELFDQFKEKYSLEDNDLAKADQIGPSIGNEIRNKAIISVAIATVGMLIYISFRFEFSYGVAAVLALVHDVLVVLSVYAILKIPVNSPFIAGMLTVVGYSINDTIVIFDRIRENMKTMKGKDFAGLANGSIKQTIVRSLNTYLTTLVAIAALYIVGVESIKDFTLPLIAGIATGTYSSIFIASPIWVTLKEKKIS